MELMDVLKKRRAVREYTDARIEAVAVERLIKAATLAPSGMNVQPWVFAALLDRKRIDEYGRRARSWLLENFERTGFPETLREMLEDPNFNIFYHAPALVIVLAKTPDRQAAEDCCLAAENLWLAARDEGIGSCWIGLARPWLNQPQVKKELGLPEENEVVAPIVLGFAKTWPEPTGRNPAEIYWLG
jgi:nitroreductase